MKKNFVVFLIKLFIYSILVYVAVASVKNNLPQKFQYEHPLYLAVFFFLVTAVFHFGMLRSAAKNNRSIVSYFMLATVLKFFLYLIVMIAYSMVNSGKATAFISNFFVFYVLLTVFEVSSVYAHFKSKPVENAGKETGVNP